MAHGALLSLVSVTAAGERLDELAMAAPPGRRTWTDGEIALAQDGQRRTLTQGSRIAVTGPSGSGKTTLLLALAGLCLLYTSDAADE